MMKHSVAVPANRQISTQLAGADFYDAYEAPVEHADKTALEIYLDVVAGTPGWANFLMAARHTVAALFGLKNLVRLGNSKSISRASGSSAWTFRMTMHTCSRN